MTTTTTQPGEPSPAAPTKKFFRPLGNRLLVKRDVAATTTSGGLHIPDVAKPKSDRGVVRYVGPGGVEASTGRFIPVNVKPGDVVIFPRSVIEVDIGDEKLVMLQEPEVLAVEFATEAEALAFGCEAAKSRRRRDAGTKRGKPTKSVEFEITTTPTEGVSDDKLRSAKESA